MARLRAAVSSALTRVGSVRILKGASVEFVQEGAESAVQEAAIRQGQVNAGHRSSFGAKDFGKAVAGGLAGGAAAGASHHPLSTAIGDDATTIAGKVSQAALTHFGVGVVASGAGSVGGPFDPLSIAGASTNAVSGGVHGVGGHSGAAAPPLPPPEVPDIIKAPIGDLTGGDSLDLVKQLLDIVANALLAEFAKIRQILANLCRCYIDAFTKLLR